MDLGLPRIDGFDACRRIREQPWGKQMLMIAITGWGQDVDRRKSQEAGFDHHLVKPVDAHEISALMTRTRARRRVGRGPRTLDPPPGIARTRSTLQWEVRRAGSSIGRAADS